MTSQINIAHTKKVALLICMLLSFCLLTSVLAQSNTILDAEASSNQPQVGSTLTVTLKISNVENLAGIDASLRWTPSVLSLKSVALNLGDSYSNGVLHGSNLNYDPDTLSPGDIYVSETKISGSYNLLAQSIGQATPGFTGSGIIAALTFNVIGTGSAGLNLLTELADHPLPGQTANNIAHQDTADSVTAIISGSSSSPNPTLTPTSSPSPSQSPTTSPTSAPTTTPKPGENNFPIAFLFVIVGLAVAAIVVLIVLFSQKKK